MKCHVTVPEGWRNFHGWSVYRQEPDGEPTVSVMFWDVYWVYGHPCQWKGTLFDPGPSVEDLAAALAERPLRNATEPVDVMLGGYAGKYLEWSVPADIDFSECDEHYFESWKGRGWATDRYQQGPGQIDRLWILDVEGSRLVIDAFHMPSATSAEREELEQVINSLSFQPLAAPTP